MKQLLKIAKKITLLVLAISFFGCTEDDAVLPKVVAGFTYTLNIDTGTVTFINISENGNTYKWDFGDESTSTEINPVKTYPTGEYKVILKATNVAGASDTSEDIIVISDVGAPVITLIGSATINIAIGGTFTDPGATATDDEDGDITANIVVGGDTVDVNTAGTYIITYNVSDAAGNAATQRTRTVIVNEADPCVADTAQSFAASSFNISFETDPGTTETVGETDKLLLGDVGYVYLDNPDFDNAVNSSCKVAKIDKAGAAPYANVQIFTADKFNLTDNAGFKLKIFSPNVGTNVLFKLEDTNNGGINNQVSQLTTIANGWEELTFDFPESDTNKFDRIIIFFGFEQGDALTIHFDELKTYTRTGGGACTAEVAESLNAADFNLTFQTNNVVVISDGSSYERTANPKGDAVNGSCFTGKVVNLGINPWDNVQINVAAKLDFNANAGFKMKVFSPKAGTKVTMKLEEIGNALNNSGDVAAVRTQTNAWEELTFAFPASQTGKFNKIVIFFDLETKDTDTYYFDDLKLYARSGGGGGGGSSCPAPPAGELLSNGDFEAGVNCWQFFAGTSISTTVNNGGSKSAEMQGATGVAVNFKQERFAIGVVQPNTSYTVSFDIIASGPFGDGGVFKAFTFSEGADGGSVPATLHVLTDNTTSLATTWTKKTYTFTTAPNANQVAGGLSFLLEIVNSSVKLNVDNVVIKKTP